jgi:hypothetical protein
MKFALILALLGVVGCSTTPGRIERHDLSADLPSRLDALSRATGLEPLDGARGDELRVWTYDYMTGEIAGYVVSRHLALECRATANPRDGVGWIERARCRRSRLDEGVMEAVDALAALDGQQWACEVEDGMTSAIEGMRDGKRFVLGASNPHFCSDARSRIVAKLLDRLHR